MEFEKNLNLKSEENTANNIQLREIIEKYLSHWKWFLLASVISILLAYLYLNFQRSKYEATATVKIKNEQGGDRSALSAFQDLGIIAPSNQNVEDEMEILLSKDLIAEVIKSLKFNTRFFTDKSPISNFFDNSLGFKTQFFKKERYLKPPLKINFLISDSLLHTTNSQFLISIKSENYYTYKDLETELTTRQGFGEKLTTVFGDVIITPNTNSVKELVGTDILVKISTIKGMADAYSKILKIEPKSDFSSVLSLKVNDAVRQKAQDFLEELVEKYNERAINLKEELSKSTSDFVTKRLEIISQELSDVDRSAESIKTRYRLSDVASQTGLNMQSGQEIESQIVQANAQLERIGFIKDFVDTKNNDDLIPVNVGVEDNNVSNTIQQYNQIMLQKKRMLENST